VDYFIQANTTTATRNATITIGAQDVQVSQAGALFTTPTVSVTPSSNSITTAQSLTVAHLAKFAEGAEAPQVLNAMVEMRARRARVRRRVAGLLRVPQSSEQNAPDLDHVKVVDQVSTVVDVLEILAKIGQRVERALLLIRKAPHTSVVTVVSLSQGILSMGMSLIEEIPALRDVRELELGRDLPA